MSAFGGLGGTIGGRCARSYTSYVLEARHLLVGIRKLVYVALPQDWIEIDPTAAVEWRPAYSGWKAWSREAMTQFENRWPLGNAARTC